MATFTPDSKDSPAINFRIKHAVVSTSSANAPGPNLAVNLPVDLLVAFDPAAGTAIFRLRTELGVRPLHIHIQNRNVQTTVYLAIEPERIACLVQERPATLPEYVTSAAPARLTGAKNPPLVCWRFALNRLGSILVPREQNIDPWGEADARAWDTFRRLAQQYDFAVYFDPAHVQQSASTLSSICEAASSGKLKSSPRHLDLATLYNGRGAVVFDDRSSTKDAGQEEAGASESSRSPVRPKHAAIPEIDDASTASPPSYDELGPAPPSPPHRPLKRPRTEEGPESPGYHEIIEKAANGLSKLLDQAAAAQESLARAVERAATTEERLQARIAEVEAANVRLRERVQELMAHIAQSDQSLEQSELKIEMTEYVDGRLEEVRSEIEDILDVKIDDAKLEIKLELQEEVEERLKQAEEEIKETIQQRSISLVFED